MLEKMAEFFDRRLEDDDEHQPHCIDSAREFLRFTAECLPTFSKWAILDLGYGTGLELEKYFKINPTAKIAAVDIAPGMLDTMKKNF